MNTPDNPAAFPAIYIAYTPSGKTACCQAHFDKLNSILSMLGCSIGYEFATQNEECANCINERAKQKENV